MKKHIVFILACFVIFGCFSAYAQTSLNSILSDDVAEELLKNGKIEYSSYMKEYTPKLFLNNAQLGEKTASYWEESGKTQKPVFYFEGIYLTKKSCCYRKRQGHGRNNKKCPCPFYSGRC